MPEPSDECNRESRIPNPKSILDDVRHRPVILADLDAADDAPERDSLFDDLLGHTHEDGVGGLPIGVLHEDRHRQIEDLADLLDAQDDLLAVDAITDLQLGDRHAVDPSLDE